jgi:hypothetical protein
VSSGPCPPTPPRRPLRAHSPPCRTARWHERG